MVTRTEFEAAMAAAPNDTVTMGAFADWLDEHGAHAEAVEWRFRATAIRDIDLPALLDSYDWGGEGPTRGRCVLRDGKGSQLADDVPDWPEYDEASDGIAYEAHTHELRRTHPLWVAGHLTAEAGLTFHQSAGLILADWLEEYGYENLAAQVRRLIG